MTIQVHSGPGTEAYRSTTYSVQVVGDTSEEGAYVYGYTDDCLIINSVWTPPMTSEQSWFRFGTDDDTATVVVSLLSGSVTSATVYPKQLDYTYTISGGVLTIELSPGSKVMVVINGNESDLLCICCDDLKPAVPGTVDTFTNTTAFPKALTGRTLYFGPGVWDIGQLYVVEDDAVLYFDGGAWVKGNLDVRGANGWRIMGPGILSGEDFDYPTILALGVWAQQTEYSGILGFDTRVGGDNSNWTDNILTGITIVATGWEAVRDGPTQIDGLMTVNCWHPNGAGVWVRGDVADGNRCSVNNCLFRCSDTALNFEGQDYISTADNNVMINQSSSAINFGFFGWSHRSSTYTTTVTNSYVVPFAKLSDDDLDYSHVVGLMVDQDVSHPTFGRFHITVDGLWIEGTHCDKSKMFTIGVQDYQWDVTWSGDQVGNIYDITFRNIHQEQTSQHRSTLIGEDYDNTPHDITFDDVWIEGVELTARNFDTYVKRNVYPYHIIVGGRTMTTAVDICNLALSNIGAKAKVTAIAPSDGSAEANACARFYEQARDTLLEMHNWNFATKRVALTAVTAGSDTDSWDYAYVIPAGFMRAISIIPTGAVNDYSFTPSVDTTSVSNLAAYQPKEFAIEQNGDGDLVLYTDEEDAVLRYAAYVTDPNLFSPLFTAALGWHLAGMLAGQLIKGDVGAAEAKRCNQMMMAYMAKATESDSNQRKIQVQVNVPWMSR